MTTCRLPYLKAPLLYSLMMLLIAALFLPSCTRKNRLDVDVSGMVISPAFHHFEDVLFNIPDTLFFEQFRAIYPSFDILFMKKPFDSLIATEMLVFKTDPRSIQLYSKKRQMMGDMDTQKDAIREILKRYHYHFSRVPEHDIYTYISGLDMNLIQMPVIVNDTLIIIFNDFFLGRDFEPYISLGIPEYKRRWMEPWNIAPEMARQLAFLKSGPPEAAETLLDQMVFQGKVLYFLDAMLPQAPDTLKIQYTQSQLEWCENNQRNIWAYLVGNNILYSTDQNISKMMIMDAPFTSTFTETSPGRLGHWLGWQIVRKYMQKHSGISLEELMQEKDAQKILAESGYKPR